MEEYGLKVLVYLEEAHLLLLCPLLIDQSHLNNSTFYRMLDKTMICYSIQGEVDDHSQQLPGWLSLQV